MTIDRILLTIPDSNLRQLYHELLTDSHFEVTAVDSFAKAVVFLVVEKYKMIVFQGVKNYETGLFMTLRKHKKSWQKMKLFYVDDSKTISQTVELIIKELQ